MTAARLFVLFSLTLQAADWLNEGRIQSLEREITPATAPGLKRLWQRSLGESGAALSSPIIMGRLITYRGTVELVFVNSSDGHVYAVDGDFGKVFWTRRLNVVTAKCTGVSTPGLTPNPPDLDPDDDGEQPRRPLYVQTPDALLHSLNPIDGSDNASPRHSACAAAWAVKKARPVSLKHYAGPVEAGGVSFTLTPSTGELQAFNASTRELLFKSGPTSATASGLAVANGHVCFTASATLYCYGFPMER